MDNVINETRLHLKLLSEDFIFDKNFIIDILKFFNNNIWHEILIGCSSLKKNSFLNCFFKEDKTNFFLKNIVASNLKKTNFQNFLNVCIEEYLYGRKMGIGSICKNFTKIEFWNNLEYIVDTFIKNQQNKEDIFFGFFIFLESIRFDKINQFLIPKKNNFSFNTLVYYLKVIPRSYQKIIKNVLKTTIKRQKINYFVKKNKKPISFYLKKLYTNPFNLKKKIEISFFKKFNFPQELNRQNFRAIIHNLSIQGITGKNVFWINNSKRIFQNILSNLIMNKIGLELKIIKKNLKTGLKTHDLIKLRHWRNQFKRKNMSNFEKFAVIFGSAIVNSGIQGGKFVDDVLSFDKLSIWSKFISGCSFSLINSNDKNFFILLPKLLRKNSISEHLRGGIILGLSFNLKKNNELECAFLKECKSILKSKELPTVKYGVCLSLSNFLSGKIKNPEKSELYYELKGLLNTDQITSEGASLSIGVLFSGLGSIFLLEELLLLILESFCQIRTRNLITSISFVFYKNKDFCNYLFNHFIEEKNPTFRQGAIIIYSLGNFMRKELYNLKILLSYLSNESDDNVKFTIVSSIGFIFISEFKLIKEILIQFINHYNPFIRLGLCFSLALSSIGLKDIKKQIHILQKLTQDKVDFVAQGACFCLGLLHFFSPRNRKIKKTVKILKSIIHSNNESKITKFGAIIGLGIIEKKRGSRPMKGKKITISPVTLHIFLNYWSWLPHLCFGFDLF